MAGLAEKVISAFLFSLSLLGAAVLVTSLMVPGLRLTYENNLDFDSLGTDLEFEGSASYKLIDEDQGLLILELNMTRLFPTSAVGKGMAVNLTNADGEISIGLSLFPKPLILNYESGKMVSFPYEGMGMITVKSADRLSGLVYIKHEKIPKTMVHYLVLDMFVQCKNGKLAIKRRKEQDNTYKL